MRTIVTIEKSQNTQTTFQNMHKINNPSQRGTRLAHSCWNCYKVLAKDEAKENPAQSAKPEDKGPASHTSGPTNQQPLLFCGSCDRIQPPEPSDSPFDVLGAPKKYNVDLKFIEKRYQFLQKQLHPDFYQNKTFQEREYSEARSSQVNLAYKKLKDPVERAQILLSSKGIEVGENAGTFDSDPAMIMDIMDKRELLESVPDSDVERLASLLSEFQALLDYVSLSFAQQFDRGDLASARLSAIHMIYLKKLVSLVMHRLPAR